MGFRYRFTLGLIWRVLLLLGALALLVAAVLTPGLAAARLVAAALAVGAGAALWQHVDRTNREVARFVEALRLGDLQAHFGGGGGAGFGELGDAFNRAVTQLRLERQRSGDELGYLQALLDDVPVAVLVIDADGRVDPANKAARRLFTRHDGARAADYAVYGATFASRLEAGLPDHEEMLVLNLGRARRAIVRSATLTRLGRRSRAVIVEPIQEALNAVEMAAQTDIVRVLTHEILNSLTPVRSLAATATELLGAVDAADDERIADARLAVATLARRAEGLGRFIESYRVVARELSPARRAFAAEPFAAELARLFAAEWPAVALSVAVDPPELALDADPDLIAQLLINLLRNAAQAAAEHAPDPRVELRMGRHGIDEVTIEVEDNGPGVAPDVRRDIFLPFFTTRSAGTGVGLNLARQIVVAHGGTIELDAEHEGGALFRIVL